MVFLWAQMGGMYGHKWTNYHGETVDSGNVWRACLKNITESQLKDGLNDLLNSNYEWPPSAIQFRKLCLKRTERELGVLNAFEAQSMLMGWVGRENRRVSDFSPFMYAIYKLVGHYALMNETIDQIKRSIREACEITTERVKRGEVLESPPQEIEKTHRLEVKLATNEQADRAMNEILKGLDDGI